MARRAIKEILFPITARDRKTRDKRQETGRQAGRQQADAHGRGRDGDAQVTLVAGRERARKGKVTPRRPSVPARDLGRAGWLPPSLLPSCSSKRMQEASGGFLPCASEPVSQSVSQSQKVRPVHVGSILALGVSQMRTYAWSRFRAPVLARIRAFSDIV